MEHAEMNANAWERELRALQREDRYRSMPKIEGLPGRLANVNGQQVLNFSSNNYLGLAGHPKVIQAAMDAAAGMGAGSTASRLIVGDTEIHRALESFIAQWKDTEAAVVFGSGYQANVGILSSLTDEKDLIISDRLNHASIIDGCRLSLAKVKVYPHLDLERLEDLLKLTGFRRKIVVTESVFSMDGDFAPLREIDSLCRRWGAFLMVDEAHASGLFGPQGQGWAAELGVVPEIQMGTLGKAVGAGGAYVAGSRSLVELLINKARSLIYTTASPPSVMGGALGGLQLIASEEGAARRTRLSENAVMFRDLLEAAQIATLPPSHIVPVVVGDSARTMQASKLCLADGVFAHGIRFPSVAEGSARLRFTLMSEHTPEDIRTAIAVLQKSLDEVTAPLIPEPRCAEQR
jgi:8-amino-7-oxononanoate synthase